MSTSVGPSVITLHMNRRQLFLHCTVVIVVCHRIRSIFIAKTILSNGERKSQFLIVITGISKFGIKVTCFLFIREDTNARVTIKKY